MSSSPHTTITSIFISTTVTISPTATTSSQIHHHHHPDHPHLVTTTPTHHTTNFTPPPLLYNTIKGITTRDVFGLREAVRECLDLGVFRFDVNS
nr:hypothetical protein [Tanacetum cinerariifolium]